MGLRPLGSIALPEHAGRGGFDHAAVHRGRRLYVAHTANDAVDVVDLDAGRWVRSVGGLTGVAGVLVDERTDLVFTSNRGENTVGILGAAAEGAVEKIAVGTRPNGLAFDPARGVLLCANVGDPEVRGSAGVTCVDVGTRSAAATLPMPGRTRWAVFDPEADAFLVNVADPFRIVVVDPGPPPRARRHFDVPARGPHGLDLDPSRHRLYCACDDGRLVSLDARSGEVLGALELSGGPDVVFLDRALDHLHVAVGDPGVIDVIDIAAWERIESVPTGPGAHTIALDEVTHRVYAFLPGDHRAAVFEDGGRGV